MRCDRRTKRGVEKGVVAVVTSLRAGSTRAHGSHNRERHCRKPASSCKNRRGNGGFTEPDGGFRGEDSSVDRSCGGEIAEWMKDKGKRSCLPPAQSEHLDEEFRGIEPHEKSVGVPCTFSCAADDLCENSPRSHCAQATCVKYCSGWCEERRNTDRSEIPSALTPYCNREGCMEEGNIRYYFKELCVDAEAMSGSVFLNKWPSSADWVLMRTITTR